MKTNPKDFPENPYVLLSLGGSKAITDDLLELYLLGKKWAGSSVLEDFHSVGDRVPQVGDYWIYLNSKDEPGCILRTENIELHKFYEVPESIAIAEGEGDLSLAYWREGHGRFWAPHLKQWGVAELKDATVITEFFRLVYK